MKALLGMHSLVVDEEGVLLAFDIVSPFVLVRYFVFLSPAFRVVGGWGGG